MVRTSTSRTTSGSSATPKSASSSTRPMKPTRSSSVSGAGRVKMIICTHAHNDHINALGEFQPQLNAPVRFILATRNCGTTFTRIGGGTRTSRTETCSPSAGRGLQVLHTPGHTPGGVSIYDGEGTVFVGDTLFKGGPGATGRKFSNFPTIIQSIRTRPAHDLPSETVVYPGHGATTTIGDEAPQLDEWIARGY